MTQEVHLPPPAVLWAQRNDVLYLTICLEDCKNPTIKIEPNSLYFKGVGGTEQKEYELTINFFKEVNPENVVQTVKGRNIELLITKKEDGPYWKRLCKEEHKQHWLKADFNKWKEEDDSEDDGGAQPDFGGFDFSNAQNPFGGLGDMGAEKPNFDEQEDSDDESLPELE